MQGHKSVLPNFHQNVNCATRGEKNSRPPLLHTEMRTKLSLALQLTIILSSTSDSVNKKVSDEADAKLQDFFASTDRNMF